MFAVDDRVYVQTTDQIFVLDTTDSLNVLFIVELSWGPSLECQNIAVDSAS